MATTRTTTTRTTRRSAPRRAAPVAPATTTRRSAPRRAAPVAPATTTRRTTQQTQQTTNNNWLFAIGLILVAIIVALLFWHPWTIPTVAPIQPPAVSSQQPLVVINNNVSPAQPAAQPAAAVSPATCSRRLMTTSELTNLVDSVASDAYADSLTVLIGRQADTQCLQDFSSPVGGWTTQGPSVIITDPGHQPLLGGTRVLKTWNFQTDWIFGAYFCPSGSTCTVPTPGRAISLDGDLPDGYLH